LFAFLKLLLKLALGLLLGASSGDTSQPLRWERTFYSAVHAIRLDSPHPLHLLALSHIRGMDTHPISLLQSIRHTEESDRHLVAVTVATIFTSLTCQSKTQMHGKSCEDSRTRQCQASPSRGLHSTDLHPSWCFSVQLLLCDPVILHHRLCHPLPDCTSLSFPATRAKMQW